MRPSDDDPEAGRIDPDTERAAAAEPAAEVGNIGYVPESQPGASGISAVAPGDSYMEHELQKERQQQQQLQDGRPSRDVERRLSRHPVIFPAAYGVHAGSGEGLESRDDAVMAGQPQGCEEKWGNSWLRKLVRSRSESCVPSPSRLDAEAAARMAEIAVSELSPGWKGDKDDRGSVAASNWTEVGPRSVVSRISTWQASTGSNFHWMRNVALDFSQLSTNGE